MSGELRWEGGQGSEVPELGLCRGEPICESRTCASPLKVDTSMAPCGPASIQLSLPELGGWCQATNGLGQLRLLQGPGLCWHWLPCPRG